MKMKFEGIPADWNEDEMPMLEGIAFSDGKLIKIDLCLAQEERRIERIFAHRTVAEFLRKNPHSATAPIEYCSMEMVEQGVRISAGGGSQGGDGYVLVRKVEDDSLVWLASFSSSNEFIRLESEKDLIMVESNLGQIWTFPLFDPCNLRIKAPTDGPHT
jgi:hypothetical protein